MGRKRAQRHPIPDGAWHARGSDRPVAAIGHDDGAGDIGRKVGGEEDRRADDVFGLAGVSPLISSAATSAPSLAKPSAMARPMPEPAPVTAAMWFCRSPGMVFPPLDFEGA